MKAEHDILINRARAKAPAGGTLANLDPVAQGRVQLLHCSADSQAQASVDELVRLSQLLPDWFWSKTAIIAREWRLLEPVRSYCEARGIPVQLASETLPPFWRLREVRAFLAFVRAGPAKMLTISQMQEFIAAQTANCWWTMISDALSAFSLELDGKAVPVADLIEMLAEWARDARQEQRGLMLLTAHRAKGLEFDDVVILDGGWDRNSRGEDRDAPRRLFYVAMTRARRSLAIMATRERHPLVGPDTQGILQRQMAGNSDESRDHALRYHLVEPQMVDLSWTGRQGRGHPVHQALEGLRTDDPVNLVDIGGRWMLQNVQGISLGRMAKGYNPPDGLRFVRGKARSIIRWRKMDNGGEYQDSLRSDEWEVVLPELVFA